jgi:hypothetical protein
MRDEEAHDADVVVDLERLAVSHAAR